MVQIEQDRGEISLGPPTSLDIFRISPFQQPDIAVDILYADTSKTKLTRMIFSLREYTKACNVRLNNLDAFLYHGDNQMNELVSSASTGEAYLYLHDELELLGASDADINAFFKTCLSLNSLYYEALQNNKLQTAQGIPQVSKAVRHQVINTIFMREFKNITKAPWHNGSDKAWEQFVRDHASFEGYIFEKRKEKDKYSYSPRITGYTKRDSYPDWLEESVITRKMVTEEYQGDAKAIAALSQRKKTALTQKQYLVNNRLARITESGDWINQEATSLLNQIPNDFFGNIILVDALVTFYTNDPAKTDRILKALHLDTTTFQQKAFFENTDKELNKNFVSGENGCFSPQLIALWIEHSLKKSGEDISKPPSSDVKNLLSIALENPTKTITDEIWQNALKANKKLGNFIYYNLRPLFEAIPEEERQVASELIKEAEGESLEELIWTISDLLSPLRQNLEEERTEDLLPSFFKAQRDLEDFSLKWLNQHWKWVHQQLPIRLQKSLTVDEVSDQIQIPQEIQPEPEQKTDQIDELEQETKALETGSLAGWQVFYVENYSFPDDSRFLVKINGETLQTTHTKFSEYIVFKKLSGNPKSVLIINELEDAVSRASTVEEQTRWKLVTHSGIEYRKRKVGHQRILYRMDPTTQRIVFFLYRKEDRSYRKL